MFRDFRYAARSLRKTPGFSIAAIVTLALGIGANTAIFSVLDGVILDPLPYREPDRLAVVALFNRKLGYPTNLSYPDFLDWQREARSFEHIAAFGNEGFDLTSPGAAEHLDGKGVSSNFFTTLGVKLALGREFSADEDTVGGRPAAVISDRVWRERFAGSPSAIGKAVTLNGRDYVIVGVTTPGFRFGNQPADVFTPIAQRDPLYNQDRTIHDILCFARLRSGVSVGQALAEMNTVQEHIGELNPATERGQGAYVVPLKEFQVGDIGSTIFLLLGAVGIVLLIACANVANLLLARSASRTREFAVRLALGASRGQIVRQLIAESMLLSGIGGLLGLTIARWGVSAVLAAAPGDIPRVENIGVNPTVLLFALGISIIVAMVFGLFPAFASANTDVQKGLKEGSRGLAIGHQRPQQVLTVLQIALTLVLLTAGSLLFRTIQNLWSVNPGFDPRHVMTFQVGLSPSVTNTPSKLRAAYQALADRIRQIPGVEASDITALVPLGRGANEGPFWIGRDQPASMAEIPRAIYYPSGADYERTMGIPLVSGRFLSQADNLNSEIVVLIDTLLAQRFFPNRNPVGQTVTIPHWGERRNVAARIVGVVGHVEHYALDGSVGEKPQIHYSFYQLPDEVVPVFRSDVTVAVRAALPVASLMPSIKNEVYKAGGDQPVYNIRTMQELVSGSMGRQRFPMILLVSFASLALLLACVGIYAVISYSTARRVNEIGVRMALGAAKSDILRLIAGQALRLALAGVAIGTAASLVLGRLFSNFSQLLYGVRPGDSATLASAALLIVKAAMLACYFPARRAANLQPTDALREE
jgi:predicted permease